MACTPCKPCGSTKWDSSIIVGKKFGSKKECEDAEKANPAFPKPKP